MRSFWYYFHHHTTSSCPLKKKGSCWKIKGEWQGSWELQMCNGFLPERSTVKQHHWDSLCAANRAAMSAHGTAHVTVPTPGSQKWLCFKWEIDFLGDTSLFQASGFCSWDKERFASSTGRLSPWCLASVFKGCCLTLHESQPATPAISPMLVCYSFSFCHFSAGTQHTCVGKSTEDYVKPQSITTRPVLTGTSLSSATAGIRRTKVKVFHRWKTIARERKRLSQTVGLLNFIFVLGSNA